MYVNISVCVYIYIVHGKLDKDCILFQVLQRFLFSSPSGPLAHINILCVVFSFPSKLRAIWKCSIDGYLQISLLNVIEQRFKI